MGITLDRGHPRSTMVLFKAQRISETTLPVMSSEGPSAPLFYELIQNFVGFVKGSIFFLMLRPVFSKNIRVFLPSRGQRTRHLPIHYVKQGFITTRHGPTAILEITRDVLLRFSEDLHNSIKADES